MPAETPGAQPPARPQTPDGETAPATRGNAAAERFGPLALTRHRKEDGRALLLYELWGEALRSAPRPVQ
jgi:hypothetical protein